MYTEVQLWSKCDVLTAGQTREGVFSRFTNQTIDK